jgi:RsiW-degrading membrane proteinase PrsW (M82 family)
MQHGLLVLPVIVPVLFWAAYHYHQDRVLPEPPANLLLCFALGFVAAGISKGLYAGLEPLGLRLDAVALADENGVALLAYALLAIGPIEEFAKMLPFLLVVLRLRAFDEPLDGIIYASFIALGYAAIENYHYLDFLTGLEATARGFAGPVIHILFASIWAHWITTARLAGKPLLRPALAGFLLAAGLHGLYDFMVLRQPVAALPIAAAMIACIWIWRLRLMRRMHEDALRETRGLDQPRS